MKKRLLVFEWFNNVRRYLIHEREMSGAIYNMNINSMRIMHFLS